MILKMVKIHQVECVEGISKEIWDGGDRSIQSLFRHGVHALLTSAELFQMD